MQGCGGPCKATELTACTECLARAGQSGACLLGQAGHPSCLLCHHRIQHWWLQMQTLAYPPPSYLSSCQCEAQVVVCRTEGRLYVHEGKEPSVEDNSSALVPCANIAHPETSWASSRRSGQRADVMTGSTTGCVHECHAE